MNLGQPLPALLSMLLLVSQGAAQTDSPLETARGWLGIVLDTTALEQSIELGFKSPLIRVEQVFPGSPAASADFHEGDLVLAMGADPLASIDELIRRVGATAPGTVVVFTLLRDGRQLEQPVALGLRPEMDELVRSLLVDESAPPLRVTVLGDGEQLTLADRAGQIVVIDFWATWCGPCRRAMPELDDLARRYAERGVSVIGVSSEDRDVLEAYVSEHPVAYVMGHDEGGETTSDYYVTAYPTLLLIDESGIVREVFIGGTEIPNLEAHLIELLAATPSVPR